MLPEDREEDAGDAPDVAVSYSDDADVAWLRKGNRAYYGYKIHAATGSLMEIVAAPHVCVADFEAPATPPFARAAIAIRSQ